MEVPQLLIGIELFAGSTVLCFAFNALIGLLTGGLGGPVMHCPECSFRGQGRTIVRGSFKWELLLWYFFIIPGIAYTLWRIGDASRVCARCHYGGLVAIDELSA
jgi:hypothetical protein